MRSSSIAVLCLLVAVINAEVKKGAVGSKHAIKNTCKKKLKAHIQVPCIRYVRPGKDGKYLQLSYKQFRWEIIEAEEGGYHIRHCAKPDSCVYWTDSGHSGWSGWDHMELTPKASTRFTFPYVGEIRHEQWTWGSRALGTVVTAPQWTDTKEAPVEAPVHEIVIEDPPKPKYKYITHYLQNRDWIIKDDTSWNWIFEPKLEEESAKEKADA